MSPVLGVAANFGTVVPIGGHASDIALDESRGLLYIANFTANRIEVMSTADYSIHTSMNVAPQPGAMSISPDSKFLLVAHYGSATPADPSKNAVTLINLNDNTRQTFSTGDTPLGVAFIADGRAFIVTSTGILLFDPISGAMQTVATFAALAKTLPVTLDTFPSQVISAALSTNPDRTMVYGIADNGTAQAFYRFDARRGELFAIGIVASPRPLARVSVSADGTWSMMGQYRLSSIADNLAQFPNSISSTNVGGNAIDSKAGIIYAQIVTAAAGGTTATAGPPQLSILDAENLLVKETFSIPENITGRSILSSGSDMLYTVSDSGVMAFPVGRMNQQHRLSASVRDVVARGTFCNRNVITQSITITDPGGGNTDFQLFANTAGVTISPSSGITPAQVQVRVDPTAFQNQNGTLSVALNLTSAGSVNIPSQIRLLINNRNPDQRGTFVNVPGALTDLLADPVRSRFYIVAQDSDQVLVFDGTNYSQIAALKTSATPTQLAFTLRSQIPSDWPRQRPTGLGLRSGQPAAAGSHSVSVGPLSALHRRERQNDSRPGAQRGNRRSGRDRSHRFRGAPRGDASEPGHLYQQREPKRRPRPRTERRRDSGGDAGWQRPALRRERRYLYRLAQGYYGTLSGAYAASSYNSYRGWQQQSLECVAGARRNFGILLRFAFGFRFCGPGRLPDHDLLRIDARCDRALRREPELGNG